MQARGSGEKSGSQFEVIGNVNSKLDSSISIPSIDINVKMVEARQIVHVPSVLLRT